MTLNSTFSKLKPLILGVFLIGLNAMEDINAQDWSNLEQFRSDNEKIGSPDKSEDRVVFYGELYYYWLVATYARIF